MISPDSDTSGNSILQDWYRASGKTLDFRCIRVFSFSITENHGKIHRQHTASGHELSTWSWNLIYIVQEIFVLFCQINLDKSTAFSRPFGSNLGQVAWLQKCGRLFALESKEKVLKSWDFRTFLVEISGIEPLTSWLPAAIGSWFLEILSTIRPFRQQKIRNFTAICPLRPHAFAHTWVRIWVRIGRGFGGFLIKLGRIVVWNIWSAKLKGSWD